MGDNAVIKDLMEGIACTAVSLFYNIFASTGLNTFIRSLFLRLFLPEGCPRSIEDGEPIENENQKGPSPISCYQGWTRLSSVVQLIIYPIDEWNSAVVRIGSGRPTGVSSPGPVSSPSPVPTPRPMASPSPVSTPGPMTAPGPMTTPRPVPTPSPVPILNLCRR